MFPRRGEEHGTMGVMEHSGRINRTHVCVCVCVCVHTHVCSLNSFNTPSPITCSSISYSVPVLCFFFLLLLLLPLNREVGGDWLKVIKMKKKKKSLIRLH